MGAGLQNEHSVASASNEESKEQPDSQNQREGIYKLFDLMKMDLGDKQTDEMKCFYEKMSQQIKEMCTDKDE